MNAIMYVFSSMTCPHCPAAKTICEQVKKERNDFILKQITSGTPGSEKLFKKFDVVSVPTIIIKGPMYNQNIGLRGVQSATTLNKYLNLSLGIEEQTKKEIQTNSFFKKIKTLFE